jgi:hypothetical protein
VTALEAIGGVGNFSVVIGGGFINVTFIGALANMPIGLMTLDATGLTGAVNPYVAFVQAALDGAYTAHKVHGGPVFYDPVYILPHHATAYMSLAGNPFTDGDIMLDEFSTNVTFDKTNSPRTVQNGQGGLAYNSYKCNGVKEGRSLMFALEAAFKEQGKRFLSDWLTGVKNSFGFQLQSDAVIPGTATKYRVRISSRVALVPDSYKEGASNKGEYSVSGNFQATRDRDTGYSVTIQILTGLNYNNFYKA